MATLTLPQTAGRKQRLRRGEDHVNTLLNVVVAGAIFAVAYADWLVVAPISLGYLYILPVSLSALINPLPVTLGLAAISTYLHDIFGPPAQTLQLRLIHNVVDFAGLLAAGILVTRIARERDRMSEEVRQQRDEYEHDLELAAHVQRQVLPQPPVVAGFDLAAGMQTARLLGGDYYDFFQLSEDVIDIVIADVSGKGAAAALLMPSLAVALRLRARELGDPAAIIADFDRVLRQVTDPATFVTMFYARLNRVTRTLRYASAGHNPPILVRPTTQDCIFLDQAGPILGILPGAKYENTSFGLERQDTLVLFTDGVTEQENRSGEAFSVQRLEKLIRAHEAESASALVATITEAVNRFSGVDDLSDDLTVVSIKVN